MAVATASREAYFVPALKNNGIYDCFEAFTSLAEVERGKGYPDIYWRAAEKIGTAPAGCVVFEDILAGVRGAKAGGFYTVAVYDRHARCRSAGAGTDRGSVYPGFFPAAGGG